jgi:hypothetical protein
MATSENKLDTAIKGLLKVISQIENHGGFKGMDFLKSSKPYWNLCCDKFNAAYAKARNPEGFRDMFYNYYDKNRVKFVTEVVEDGEINDEWLKNKEVLPLPNTASSAKKKKRSDDEFGFSLRSISCRGEIIYFDETNDKIRNVCIPIGEAYLAACKIYVDGAKNGEYSPLPAQLLHNLYSVIAEVCDEEDQTIMATNVKSLKEIVDSLTSDDSGDNGEGTTLDPIKGVMKKLMGTFGNSGGEMGKLLEGDGLTKMVSSLFNDEVSGKIKNVWNTFTDKVKVEDTQDIGTLINNVSEAMKDQTLQNTLKETIATVATATGLGAGAFDLTKEEQSKMSPSEDISAPTEQE